MQTFLPYPDFARSAAVLDRQRLGKQRLEALDILDILHCRAADWLMRRYGNHPAVRMWAGHTAALAAYGLAVCDEWLGRGHHDTRRPHIARYADQHIIMPPWLGDPALHSAYRAWLLYKAPEHYGQFGWTERPAIFTAWPV